MGLTSLRKRHTWNQGFHMVPHWFGNDSFNVRFRFLFFPSLLFKTHCSAIYCCICLFCLFCLSHFWYSSVFIYIIGGLEEHSNDCVHAERDNSYLYSYLGCIQWSKMLTSFVGDCCISCIPFLCPTEMSLGYVPDYSMFCVLIGQNDTFKKGYESRSS